MFTPDMFLDHVHNLHFVLYTEDGVRHVGDVRITEHDLGQMEWAEQMLKVEHYHVWFSNGTWQFYSDARLPF